MLVAGNAPSYIVPRVTAVRDSRLGYKLPRVGMVIAPVPGFAGTISTLLSRRWTPRVTHTIMGGCVAHSLAFPRGITYPHLAGLIIYRATLQNPSVMFQAQAATALNTPLGTIGNAACPGTLSYFSCPRIAIPPPPEVMGLAPTPVCRGFGTSYNSTRNRHIVSVSARMRAMQQRDRRGHAPEGEGIMKLALSIRARQIGRMYIFKTPSRSLWSVVCGTCAVNQQWPDDVVWNYALSHQQAMAQAAQHQYTCPTARRMSEPPSAGIPVWMDRFARIPAGGSAS